MLVVERIVDEKPRLEFKYKIKSGPTTIKSYGLTLAKCLRFPSSLIDRAEELLDKVKDETFINISNDTNRKKSRDADETTDSSRVSDAIAELDKDVIDLYSYVLLLMSTEQKQQVEWISINTINEKVERLINMMTPELKEMIETSSLEEVISVLNTSKTSEVI